MAWVIETLESPMRHPIFFVGFSAGRCFIQWSDEYEFARKFEIKKEAEKFAAENRIYCGFRISLRKAAAVA